MVGLKIHLLLLRCFPGRPPPGSQRCIAAALLGGVTPPIHRMELLLLTGVDPPLGFGAVVAVCPLTSVGLAAAGGGKPPSGQEVAAAVGGRPPLDPISAIAAAFPW